jgi:molybdate transport system substrate-binding protein
MCVAGRLEPLCPGWLRVLLLALPPLLAVPTRAEELRVMAAGATESTLRKVVGSFETGSGATVELTYGAVGLLRDRISQGELADLAIVTPAIIEQLEAKGLVRSGSRVDLGRVGGGIAVRVGEKAPAVGSPGELREALLAAEAIYFPDPKHATAGAYFLGVADRLGVGDAVRRKARMAAGGKEAMRLMADSSAHALGVTQISEILSVSGVVLVAPYPGPLQTTTTYSGIVLASAKHPETAEAFVHFLASSTAQAQFHKAGFEGP